MQHLEKMSQNLMIKPKLLYFTIALTFYMFHQFKGQFIFERFGIEKGKLGLYLSVPQAFSFFSNIYIGGINDRTGKQKFVLVSLFIIGGIFFDSFFWTTKSSLFWVYYTLYFSFMSATIPLLDKVMMDFVSEVPGLGSKAIGRQRIWLTLGYLVTNFSIEDIISTKDPKVMNYNTMRPFNVLVTGLSIVFLLMFVKNVPRRQSNIHYLSSVKCLLKNFEYVFFIFIIILCGISRAFMTTYLGLYYSKILDFNGQKNNLNLPGPLNNLADWAYKHKQSTTTVFGVLLEVVGFYQSSAITDKLGFFWPILLSQVFQLLRFGCYYNLSRENNNSFAYCCLFELLKGANYSLIHIAALQLANYFCPPDLRTTSQLFYSGSFVAIGTILSGLLFQNCFSPDVSDLDQSYNEFKTAFFYNIILSVVGLLFFIFKYGIYENLLFSSENQRRKIAEFEIRAIADEKHLENMSNNENNNVKA